MAQSVLAIALREARRQPASVVHAVHLRIGPWAGVEPASLRFAFDCLKLDTPLANATLAIEEGEGADLVISSLELELI